MLEQRHHDTKPSARLAAYVGTYEHPAYGSALVTLARGQPVWTLEPAERAAGALPL